MHQLAEAPARPQTTLEASLATTEADAELALAQAAKLVAILKQAHTAATTGDLKALHKAFDGTGDLLERLAKSIQDLQSGWSMSEADQEAYLASGAFQQELLEAAAQAGLNLFEQETFLACYPSLVKIQPRDRSVLIDRKTYRALRPAHLVAYLTKIQKKSPKTNVAQFLETLYAAWQLLNQKRGGGEKLLDIYRCLTLLPAFRQEYTQQEFARDVYLLDGAALPATKEGVHYRLHPGATGAKNRSNLLIVVTREGLERTYYSIEFMA